MHIGIVAATAAEARVLARTPIPTAECVCLPQGDMVFLSGMGAEKAHTAARKLIEQGATALVSWGCCGGLSPECPPGTLVLPERIIAADRSVYHVDQKWHARLCLRLADHVPLCRGTLTESPTVVTNPAEKAGLFIGTGAVAVDLESASIARAAGEAGTPFVAIRAIADDCEGIVPPSSLLAVDNFGRVRLLRLLAYLASHPGELPPLLRLGRDFRTARATLIELIRMMGGAILGPGQVRSAGGVA